MLKLLELGLNAYMIVDIEDHSRDRKSHNYRKQRFLHVPARKSLFTSWELEKFLL